MKKLLILLAAGALCACGDEYDDRQLTERVDRLEGRIVRLEELCKQMNTNISSLQTIVTALQGNDYVTGVTPVMNNGAIIGYTIAFTKSAPVTIYHGTDGKDGLDGSDGKDGKDGRTPVVGVRQDADGLYYWTLDGDWLLDGSGAKIRAEGRDGKDGAPGADGEDGADGQPGAPGKDGKDGITPQLKIENGYWYVSTDDGATWTNLGKATGEDGKDGEDAVCEGSFFRDVDASDDEYVLLTLADGTLLSLPKYRALTVSFAEGDEFFFDNNETVTVHYTIAGGSDRNVVKAEMQNLDGYALRTTPENATTGTIAITAGIPTTNNVIVSVSDGKQTIMAAIAVSIKPSLEENVITVETPGTLASLIAGYYKNSITELTIIGNLNAYDISTLTSLRNLAALDMEQVDLEELPSSAFSSKTSLTDIKLPKTLKTIGDNAFFGCSYLTSATIGNGVTTIGTRAFRNCISLTSVTIPNSVTTIETQAFSGCGNLTSATLSNKITTIENRTFSNCGLTSITIPNSVTAIGNEAFQDCASLTSATIGNSVTTIGDHAFSSCSSLTSVTIPDRVTTIGIAAFFNCSSLTSVTIGSSVTTIKDGAFSDCSNLTSVTIGSNVTTIGDRAFSACYILTSIYCKAPTPPATETSICDNWVRCTLYVPAGCKEAYAAAGEWRKAKEIIEMEF